MPDLSGNSPDTDLNQFSEGSSSAPLPLSNGRQEYHNMAAIRGSETLGGPQVEISQCYVLRFGSFTVCLHPPAGSTLDSLSSLVPMEISQCYMLRFGSFTFCLHPPEGSTLDSLSSLISGLQQHAPIYSFGPNPGRWPEAQNASSVSNSGVLIPDQNPISAPQRAMFSGPTYISNPGVQLPVPSSVSSPRFNLPIFNPSFGQYSVWQLHTLNSTLIPNPSVAPNSNQTDIVNSSLPPLTYPSLLHNPSMPPTPNAYYGSVPQHHPDNLNLNLNGGSRDETVVLNPCRPSQVGNFQAQNSDANSNQTSEGSATAPPTQRGLAMSDWGLLLTDMIDEIFKKLAEGDLANCRAVCRAWNRAAHRTNSRHSIPLLIERSIQNSSCLEILSPITLERSIISLEKKFADSWLAGPAYGYLISYERRTTQRLHLYNAFTKQAIPLPFMRSDNRASSLVFQPSLLYNKDTTVVISFLGVKTRGDNSLTFYKCQAGDDDWKAVRIDDLAVSGGAHAYFEASYYIIESTWGPTRVIDPDSGEVICVIPPIETETSTDQTAEQHVYLVESPMGLLRVSRQSDDELESFTFRIHCLNNAKWERVYCIENCTLFLEKDHGLCVENAGTDNFNTIFFTRSIAANEIFIGSRAKLYKYSMRDCSTLSLVTLRTKGTWVVPCQRF
ncbi:F-box domain-containing protein [Rhynchospora pubera]|uniref:F-box domain-containing protein n=1 Tax=Rhynchospora pubera TaxID=906938 RepID=A0AAV8BVA0_9POAL|nr:F-box domain-containing protein [Rhynchospora pubera]